jgi:hypothetical protein
MGCDAFSFAMRATSYAILPATRNPKTHYLIAYGD